MSKAIAMIILATAIVASGQQAVDQATVDAALAKIKAKQQDPAQVKIQTLESENAKLRRDLEAAKAELEAVKQQLAAGKADQTTPVPAAPAALPTASPKALPSATPSPGPAARPPKGVSAPTADQPLQAVRALNQPGKPSIEGVKGTGNNLMVLLTGNRKHDLEEIDKDSTSSTSIKSQLVTADIKKTESVVNPIVAVIAIKLSESTSFNDSMANYAFSDYLFTFELGQQTDGTWQLLKCTRKLEHYTSSVKTDIQAGGEETLGTSAYSKLVAAAQGK